MYLNTNPSGSTSGINFNDEDQLYQLAQMQGGAIADAANELAHPNTGILSTVGNSFKNMFKGFIDVISIPSEIVAGAISSDVSVSDAIKQHLTIDNAIFGDTPIFGQEGSQTIMQKVGGFIVRAPTAILLDPLTYLTFGTGTLTKVGVKGIQALAAEKLVQSEITAAKLIGKEAETFFTKRMRELEKEAQLVDPNVSFAAEKTLSSAGQETLDKYRKVIQSGTENTFYKEEAIKLVNNSADEFGKPTLSLTDAVEQVKQSVRAGGIEKQLLRETIDASLDMERAKEALGNLIARKPALYETLLDKGGIKYFGRTMLSSQRIQSAIETIPIIKNSDLILKPFRDKVYSITKDGKEYSRLERRWADLAKTRKTDAVKNIINIFTENNISANEADFITSAIEAGKMPTDPVGKAAYLASLGIDSDEASKLIGSDKIINAIREIQGVNKMNYKQAIAAGIPLTKRDNYMLHLADLKDAKEVRANVSPSVKLGSAKHAEVQKFTSARGITGEQLIGTAKYHNLERYYPSVHQRILDESLKKTEERFGIKIKDIQDQTIELQSKIQDTFSKFVEKDFTELINRSIPDARALDVQSAMKVLKESIPNLDFAKLKEMRIKALEESSTEVANIVGGASAPLKEKILKVIQDIQSQTTETPVFAKNVNEAVRAKLEQGSHLLDGDIVNIEKALSVNETDPLYGEAINMLANLKKARKTYNDKLVESNIDSQVMSDYMDKLVQHFNENQVGVKHLLRSLAGKDTKLVRLMEELSDRRFAIMKEMDDTGELAMMDADLYRSQQGDIFRASRPTIIEANNAGFNFEQNSFALAVHSSVNTVKATVSKNFIDEVATKFGKLESEAPEGYVEVNVSGLKDAPVGLSNWLTGKNGEKILFHPEIAKRIENFNKSVINDEDINAVLNSFDKLTGLFKASVTSIFPAFHGRNAISNAMNSFLDIGYAALNPARHVMSAQISRTAYKINSLKADIVAGKEGAQAELYRELNKEVFTDRRGYVWTQGQLEQVMRNNNVALGNQFGEHIDAYRHTKKEMVNQFRESLWGIDEDGKALTKSQKLKKSIPKGVNTIFDRGQQFGQLVEDHSRIIHFLEHLDRTGDVHLAAERTKMFLFDYGDLSNFERVFMKRVIPFYTWMKKNVELQAKVLATAPGRIGQQVHAFNTLSSAMSGGNGLTEEEYNNLPVYMKNQFNVVASRSGEKLYVLSGFGSPLEAAFDALQPRTLLSATNPFLKLPVELTTGYDTFRAGMMSDTNNAQLIKNAPQLVKDLAGFVHYQYKDPRTGKWVDRYTATNPKMFFFLMNQPIGSRLFSEYLHQRDAFQKMGWEASVDQKEMLRASFGIKGQDIDFDQLSARAQKERVKKLQDLLEESGIIYKLDKPTKSKNTRVLE